MNKEQCKQDEWATMRKTNRSKENEWALIYSNQLMQNSQIINICNDGEDNDLESLGKGHLSFTHKIHNEIGLWRRGPLKAHNSHKQLIEKKSSQRLIYTLNGEDTIHKYMYLFFLFFISFYLCILWISNK